MNYEKQDTHFNGGSMRKPLGFTTTVLGLAAVVGLVAAKVGGPRATPMAMTPADGHSIHVLAPHVIEGKVMGPFHHYCKVTSPEPFIECLIYLSTDSMASLVEVEYIVAKTVTRTNVISLADWNKNWHDHQQEIATGRVQVLDVPDSVAAQIAGIVSKTDGIIFHLWHEGAKVPTGKVVIGQSVGHVNITQAEKFMAGGSH
jgi:hypothetical protein